MPSMPDPQLSALALFMAIGIAGALMVCLMASAPMLSMWIALALIAWLWLSVPYRMPLTIAFSALALLHSGKLAYHLIDIIRSRWRTRRITRETGFSSFPP